MFILMLRKSFRSGRISGISSLSRRMRFRCAKMKGHDGKMMFLVGAGARFARMVTEACLSSGLVHQFWNPSASRIDEPIADLPTSVSLGNSDAQSRMDGCSYLRHLQTGLPAEHLLFVFTWVGMAEVVGEPLLQHIGCISRQVAPSSAWHRSTRLIRFKLDRPLMVTILVLMMPRIVATNGSWRRGVGV